jgi:hypothetical protein
MVGACVPTLANNHILIGLSSMNRFGAGGWFNLTLDEIIAISMKTLRHLSRRQSNKQY